MQLATGTAKQPQQILYAIEGAHPGADGQGDQQRPIRCSLVNYFIDFAFSENKFGEAYFAKTNKVPSVNNYNQGSLHGFTSKTSKKRS